MSTLVSTQTPHRVSFVGGGTDLPEVSEAIGGAVLNIAIRQYVYVTVKKHSGLFHDKYRLQYASTEYRSTLSEIQNDIIRMTLLHFNINDPLMINTFSDLPDSCGLGSSSSFSVGLVNALNTMFCLGIANSSIAETAFQIERSVLGSSVGRQDMYAAATGGINLFEFGSKHSISPIHNSDLISEKLLSCMKIYWTNIQRSASEQLSEQIKLYERNIPKYIKMKELAINTYSKVCLMPEDLIQIFAESINLNRNLKYTLSDGIVSDEVLKLERRILDNGAIATKLLGAGGGGFILALFPNKIESKSSEESIDLISLPVELDLLGTRVTQDI